MTDTAVHIRHSQLAAFHRCRRKEYLQYVMNLTKPKEDGDIRGIGTLVHGLLAQEYSPDAGFESPDLTHEFSFEDQELGNTVFQSFLEDRAIAGDEVGDRTLAVEIPLEYEIDPGFFIYGQIDRVYQDEHDHLVGSDWKIQAQFQTTADDDFQLLTYALLLHRNGYSVDYMEQWQIKRNKRTAQAKRPFDRRNRIEITPEKVEWWERSLRYQISQLLAAHHIAEVSGLGVEHPAIWSVGRNDCSWSCDFADVCGIITSGDDYATVLELEYVQREEEPHDTEEP